ncbi:hypothetical protein SLS62_002555 [Diatrype stigma]|uniref:beta-glucosidase n=1 Tax=Diatrype stigma TaxID=117547 RepID=A0AAN9YUZ4_9PEZI
MLSSLILSWAALAPLLLEVRAQDVITDDTFFYGQSEPVYPTPETSELGAWADAVSKAKAFVGQLTLEEKVNLTAGATSQTGCSGFIPNITRLNFPGMCLMDAGNGVRGTDYVNAWPAGLHVGASWNKDLAHQRAHFMGSEAKIKGVNVLLGPFVGPIGRVVRGGRSWEGFSVDPYLTGALVHETVSGTQNAGVITTTKSVSSNVDDKAMHELYLWPFYDAVKAGTGTVMCSYNRVNNSYGCQNSKTLNGLLKGELGFQGFVVSDWGAQMSGVASALGGLDVAMPNGAGKWAGNLSLAIANGSVPKSRLDDMATRVLASWYQMKQDDQGFPAPGYGMPADLTQPHEVVDARNASAKPTLFDGAVEGHVLVKNANGVLPLDPNRMKLISLFGYSAKAPDYNTPENAEMLENYPFGPWAVGAQAANWSEVNIGWMGNLSIAKSDIAPNGTLVSGGGSGASAQGLISAPYDALVSRCQDDGTALFWDFDSGSPAVNPTSDVCIVFGNVWATEGYDRPTLRDNYTDGLIENVASQCANTIVVFHNAGVRLVDSFIDHPNVTAVIFAHLPGQESGKALVSLLYGDSNPSGRLPYTVARSEADYGQVLAPELALPGERYGLFPQSDFIEGVFIDYRHFDAKNITPRFEFGFGLSYTTFDYSGLSASVVSDALQPYPTGLVVEGGQEDLWDVVAVVEASVTNTGGRDGKEVVQLYLGLPGEDTPAKQLRGFEKPLITAGETATVKFELTRRDLSIWDIEAQKWLLQDGSYGVFVGRSSRDLPLIGTLTVNTS